MSRICPVCGTSYPDTSAFCPTDGTTLIAEKRGDDMVGSVIADRYKVSRLLGEGGMGRVYLARHVRLPQQVAIKVLNPGMVADPDAVARFNREAANAASIEHDRVARVFDFGGTPDGSVYLAMEYVPGRSLHALVSEAGRLAPARAAQLTFQVAEGLDAAHRLGIVHRDLKPDNIMVVTDDAGADRCKVVDFGIAKAANAAGGTRLTRTGMVVGTPEYMSPEQVMGEEIDARSDVYALALVSYNAFTGTLPFQAATPERAIAVRMMEDPRPLSVAMPEVAWPSDLQSAFDRALERDAASRTPTALEFAEAVVAAVEGWVGEPVLRSRTPLSIRTVATPSATPAVASPTLPRSTIPAPPVAGVKPMPETRAPRSPAPRVVLAVVGIAVLAAVGWLVTKDGGEEGGSSVVASADSTGPKAAGVAAESMAANRPADTIRASQGATRQTPSAAPGGATLAATPAVPVPDATPVRRETPADARRTLDSLTRVLEDQQSGEGEAKAAVPVLERLLGSMATPTDSTWTYLALVSAHGQAGAPLRACNALRSASRLATTAAQRAAITTWFESEAVACVR
ncbi:MAG: protein kinase domain-containing protein [Gemmatimonadaceae bacterium]